MYAAMAIKVQKLYQMSTCKVLFVFEIVMWLATSHINSQYYSSVSIQMFKSVIQILQLLIYLSSILTMLGNQKVFVLCHFNVSRLDIAFVFNNLADTIKRQTVETSKSQ